MIADIDGPVHYAHYEGPAGAPRVMYLHGLGGSLSNWSDLAPLLTSHVRAIAVDLPGFGASPSAGRRTTVAANAAIVTRLLHEVVDEPTILIGNSMGALISTLVAGNEPDRVRAVVLIDPPLPVAAPLRVHGDVRRSAVLGGMPGIGEVLFNRRLATVPAHERVRQMLQRCCADPNRISSAMWEATVADEQQRSSDGPAPSRRLPVGGPLDRVDPGPQPPALGTACRSENVGTAPPRPSRSAGADHRRPSCGMPLPGLDGPRAGLRPHTPHGKPAASRRCSSALAGLRRRQTHTVLTRWRCLELRCDQLVDAGAGPAATIAGPGTSIAQRPVRSVARCPASGAAH